jgi:hypothetical protein
MDDSRVCKVLAAGIGMPTSVFEPSTLEASAASTMLPGMPGDTCAGTRSVYIVSALSTKTLQQPRLPAG